jgi:subtilisin family serine protease
MSVRRVTNGLPGRYLVSLREVSFGKGREIVPRDVHNEAVRLSSKYGGRIVYEYIGTIPGFCIEEISDSAIEELAGEGSVEQVEQDQLASLARATTRWGLDRIDQKTRQLDGNFNPPNNGKGVVVYVIDSGIWVTHSEFGGRASFGESFVGSTTLEDCDNHGTGVASVIGGDSLGVANEAGLVSVRVCCGGQASAGSIGMGVDWVARQAPSPAVANISLTTKDNSTDLIAKIGQAVSDGTTFVVAAGNDGEKACVHSPADSRDAIVVAASNKLDFREADSNIGKCVDIFAPGEDIPVASASGGETTFSGTSYAAAHVSGAAAIFLAKKVSAKPQEVKAAILVAADKGKIIDPGLCSPNLFLYTGLFDTSRAKGLKRFFVSLRRAIR